MNNTLNASYLNTSGPYQGPEQEIIDFAMHVFSQYKRVGSDIQKTKDLTRELLSGLTEMAKSYKTTRGIELKGQSSYTNEEWLYDVSWFANTVINTAHLLDEVILVCESELSDVDYYKILRDFNKLLIANCPYRVFICKAEPKYEQPGNVNRRIEFFNSAVATCQNLRPGDRVLVLIWDDWKTGEVFPHLIVKQ